jgi:hypothetical protein
MNPWGRAVVQGPACGLVFGLVLLAGGRMLQPQVAAAQVEQPAVAEVVKARRLEMVDAAGNRRAVLSVLPDGNMALLLSDAAGNLRATLNLAPDGSPGLALGNARGR